MGWNSCNNVQKMQGAQLSNDIYKLTPAQGKAKECYRCGQHYHKPAQCPYRGSKCHGCGKIGYLKRKCRRKQQQPQQPPRLPKQPPGQPVRTVTDKSETSLSLDNISDKSIKPFTVKVKLNDKPLSMELDTNVTVYLISSKTFQQLFPGVTVQPTATQLHSYSEDSISVLGQVEEVTYDDQLVKLPIVVVSGEGPSLFGRDWMMKIKPNWKEIYTVAKDDKLAELLKAHSTLFEPGLSTLNDYKAKIYMDLNVKPKFVKHVKFLIQ